MVSNKIPSQTHQMGVAVDQLVRSEGWEYLRQSLKERLDVLDDLGEQEITSEKALCIVKERSGILFIIKSAKDLIENGGLTYNS